MWAMLKKTAAIVGFIRSCRNVGTVFATLQWIGKCALFCCAWPPAGCVVLAPVDPVGELAKPMVLILKDKVVPAEFGPVTIYRSNAEGVQFSLVGAVKATAISERLYYYWYYDYFGESTVLAGTPMCTFAHTCTVIVCARAKGDNDYHTLLAVVANRELVDGAKEPFGFPAGTVFDSYQWQLKLLDSCPK